MELYQLKTFIEIAERGSLTEAAARLHMSQPAASAHIKALEKEVGFPLFYRTAKGMILTEKGSRLLPEARSILASIAGFYGAAGDLQSQTSTPVRIGLNTNGEVLRIGGLIESLHEELPQVEPHLIDIKSEEFLRELTSQNIDGGFYYGRITHPSLQAVKLHAYRMVVVYPNAWEVPEDVLTLAYLAEKPWIWTTRGCPFYKQSIDYFEAQALLPRRIMYVDDEHLIGELVQNEVGCSLLAEPVAQRFADENKLRLWNGIELQIDLHFGYAKDRRDDLVLQEICAMVQRIWDMGADTDGGSAAGKEAGR